MTDETPTDPDEGEAAETAEPVAPSDDTEEKPDRPDLMTRITGVGSGLAKSLIIPALAFVTALIIGAFIIMVTDVDTLKVWVGGYALFQQDFPENFLNAGLRMFLQIGSDHRTGMCWGDAGELTFYVDDAALAGGAFERIMCEYQCG